MTRSQQHHYSIDFPRSDAKPDLFSVISPVLPRPSRGRCLPRPFACSRLRREGTDPALRGVIGGRPAARGGRGART